MRESDNITWSLVTVSYNNSAVLKKYWANQDRPANLEWIVVDNASDDDSADVAEALGARVIRMPKNCGFGASNNVGFDHSRGDFVAFVNPDVTVDYSSLDDLREVIEETDGLVAPQLINDDGSLQANGRGWPFLAHKIRHRLKPESLDDSYRLFAQTEDRKVTWFIGAAVAGRRETLACLGPWDSSFFLYYEDADICLRARKMGYESIVCSKARWVHGWQRETSSFSFGPWKRELASMVRFYLRYPSLLSVFPDVTASRLDRK